MLGAISDDKMQSPSQSKSLLRQTYSELSGSITSPSFVICEPCRWSPTFHRVADLNTAQPSQQEDCVHRYCSSAERSQIAYLNRNRNTYRHYQRSGLIVKGIFLCTSHDIWCEETFPVENDQCKLQVTTVLAPFYHEARLFSAGVVLFILWGIVSVVVQLQIKLH